MGAEVNLLPCTDCSPGLIIPPVTALWLMDIGWSEIANWKIGVEHRDFYEFTLWVKLRDVFKHFIFDHEPFKFTTKNILYVCQHNERFTLSLCLITAWWMKMISLVIAMIMFNAAVTSPLFPAEGKHLLIETEDSESISRNHHSESSEETTPYTGAYVLIRLGRSPQTQQSLKSLNLTSST